MPGRQKFTNERQVLPSVAVVRRHSNSQSCSRSNSKSRHRSYSQQKRTHRQSHSYNRSHTRSRSHSHSRHSKRHSYTKLPLRCCQIKSPSRCRSVSVNKNDHHLDTITFRSIIQAQQSKIEELLCSQKEELEARINSKWQFVKNVMRDNFLLTQKC